MLLASAAITDWTSRRACSAVWLAKPTGSCNFRYMSAIEEIQRTVLALPLEQRVFLAESLLQSLPPLADEMSEVDICNILHRFTTVQMNWLTSDLVFGQAGAGAWWSVLDPVG